MSKTISEIGVNIYQAKQRGQYYQATYEYTFEPKYFHTTQKKISFLQISESDAVQVIEFLQLQKRDIEGLIQWVCKQDLKRDSYNAKYIRSIKSMTRGMVLDTNP